MSYQVLARKWRPATFTEVVGQQHVLTALANGLSLGRIHHAYLFSGTRGVGKTSIARLLAKGLNCDTGVTASPCGTCESCQQISQGRFVDLIEIDAASRTKVEDTRELLDNVQYAPVSGRYKIYLIDEVHMLSRHSFNALLKTLEEPPEHVKFLLATTDPQKLPVTILSRCLQFHLKALDSGQIRGQLERILTAEHILFEPRALQLLARAADGSLRDALSLTDQAIASGGGQLTSDAVSSMLGTLGDEQALLLLDALSRADGEQVMVHIQSAASRGVEWDALLAEMLQLLHGVAMAQLLPAVAASVPDEAEQRQRELARRLSPEDIQLYYQILLIGRKELTLAPDQRMGVEMTLLRALAFHPKTAQAQPAISGSLPVVAMSPASSPLAATPPPSMTSLASAMASPSGAEELPVTPTAKETPQETTIMPGTVLTAAPSDVELPKATSSVLQARQQLQRLRQLSENRQPAATPATSHQGKAMTGFTPPAGTGLSSPQRQSLQPAPVKPALPEPESPESEPPEPEPPEPESPEPPLIQQSSAPRPPAQAASAMVTAPANPEVIDRPVASQQDYRWLAQTSTDDDAIRTTTTPAALRSIMECEKTPELAAKIAAEAIERDEWTRQISTLQIPKLVEQLALNCYKQQNGNNITLHVRSAWRQLNTPVARQALQQALSENGNGEVELTITEDDNPQQLTPQEWRNAIYAEKLELARQAIITDSHIQTLCQFFEAELDDNSIQPI